MTRFGFVTRIVKSFLAEVKSLGGVTQNRFISPKGLYSKPKGENAIIINLSKSRNQDVVMAIQKEVELEDGDVYVTDDKSFIHFHFKEGGISLKTKKLTYDVDEFDINTPKLNINGADVKFTGGSVKHNGTSIDDTHTHSQSPDSAGNSQVDTNPPS